MKREGEVFYIWSAIVGALIWIPLSMWILGGMLGPTGIVVGFVIGCILTIWGAYGKPRNG